AGARESGLSPAAAGNRAPVGAARKVQENAECGAVCHRQFLARSGRAGRSAFLRDRGPLAVRGAKRSGGCGASACLAGGGPEPVRGVPSAGGGVGTETGLWEADPRENRPRRAGLVGYTNLADAVW